MSFVDTRAAVRFAADKLQKINLFQTAHMFCDVYCLEPGQAQQPHAHEGATKFYFVLEGRVRASLGTQVRELGPGELAWSAPGESHGVENASSERALLLVAMSPNPNAPAHPHAK
ncbi:MAG: cupin domain-containing protein [Planctomycetes bacterium]|nr:cupin domain-containing protein [Planctomycetota bacterium]